jgi:hypothetical protein
VSESTGLIGIFDSQFGISFLKFLLPNRCKERVNKVTGGLQVFAVDPDPDFVKIADGGPHVRGRLALERAVDSVIVQDFFDHLGFGRTARFQEF